MKFEQAYNKLKEPEGEYTDGKNIYTVIYSQKVDNKHNIRTDEQAIINGTEYAINIIPGPNSTNTMAKAKEYRDKTSCVDPLKDLTRSYPTPDRTIFAKNVMKNHIAVR